MDARLSDAVFSAPAAPTLGGPGPPAPVPAQPRPRTARVRVTSEAVGVRGALGGYYRSLSPWIDDLTREFGPDTYDRMQLDDQVSSSLRALCHGVLSDELVLRPGVDDKKDPDFVAAKDALGFCERATWQQTGGLDQWLLAMLKGAVGGGNRVSETVYRPEESGKDAGKWVPDRLKVKPRRSVAFAVDSCNNLAGILGLPPGGATWGGLAWGTTFDPANPPDNFLPREKFCVLTWDPHDEDPRGWAILRCVYEPWWAKLQASREWLAYLAQFGSPGLVGTTAPGADSSAPTDAYGNPVDGPVLTPEQDMANKVMEHRNGGVHILPNGATLDVLQSSNAGDAFLKKVDSCDRAIAQGINLAMRAVMQSRFGSRADAEQGQDVAGLQTRFMKRWLARMVTEDLLRPLVRVNYGPDAARRLCPYASLSPVEHQDLGTALVAVSGAWKNGLIKNSQLPWVYEQFGMPPATEEELAAPPPQPPAAPGGSPGAPPAPGSPPAPPQAPFAWEDQPRVPAGSPEGGEWGSGGGGVAESKAAVKLGRTGSGAAVVDRVVRGPLGVTGGLSPGALAALAGAPDDARVRVLPGEDRESLKITVKNRFKAVRVLRRVGGSLVMENKIIEVDAAAQGQGLGSDVFARQVDAARALGVAAIVCHAARAGGFNGYYTWPRLGYDQSFEDLEGQGDKGLADRARAAFPGAESVLQVMATPEGRAWWKQNGTDLRRARFDLADGSPSMTVFATYRAEQAASAPAKEEARRAADAAVESAAREHRGKPFHELESLPRAQQDLLKVWYGRRGGKEANPNLFPVYEALNGRPPRFDETSSRWE